MSETRNCGGLGYGGGLLYNSNLYKLTAFNMDLQSWNKIFLDFYHIKKDESLMKIGNSVLVII